MNWEFYGLYGWFTGQVQYVSGILDIALPLFLKESVHLRNSRICTDCYSVKGSAIAESGNCADDSSGKISASEKNQICTAYPSEKGSTKDKNKELHCLVF